MDTATPSRLGSYVLLRWLGRGGMAEVFFAARTGAAGFQRPVVVKRMLGIHREDPAFVRMFINEAKVAARLSHPNIVQVYELDDADGELFIAMEFIHGRNLAHITQAHIAATGRPLPAEAVAWIAREVARGLHHAHRHCLSDGTPTPIVHRDVSPHNIMIGYDGAVKVVDFGIAKPAPEVGDETRTGELKGKVAYMAPEQISGRRPGPAADQWALGVVMHEMLTGRRLFKSTNDWETAARVKSAVIEPPSATIPELPPAVDALVMRPLDRDPHARFADLEAMYRSIDEWLGARFGAEQMAHCMTSLFGAEERQPPDVTGMMLAATQADALVDLSAAPTGVVDKRPNALVVGLLLAAVSFLLVVGVGLTVRRLRHPAQSAAAVADPAPSASRTTTAQPAPPSSPSPTAAPSTNVANLATDGRAPLPAATAPVSPAPTASQRSNSHHDRPAASKKQLPVFEDPHVRAVDEP